MKRDAVLEALGLETEVSGAYAGGWLEGLEAQLSIEGSSARARARS